MSGESLIKQEPQEKRQSAVKTEGRQILVNLGLGRKKVFLLDGQSTLDFQFKNYASLDPAFSQLLRECLLVFQEFNSKFGTWVDIDSEDSLDDGTVVRVVFFPKAIEVDEKHPGSVKRKRRECDSVLNSDCLYVGPTDVKKIPTITIEESSECEENVNSLKSKIKISCQQSSENNKLPSSMKNLIEVTQTCNEHIAPCLQEEKDHGETVESTTDNILHCPVTISTYSSLETPTSSPQLSSSSHASTRCGTVNLLQDPGTKSSPNITCHTPTSDLLSSTSQTIVASTKNNVLQSPGKDTAYSSFEQPAFISAPSSLPQTNYKAVDSLQGFNTNSTYSNVHNVTPLIPSSSCTKVGNIANILQSPCINSRYANFKCITPLEPSSNSQQFNFTPPALHLSHLQQGHNIPWISQPVQVEQSSAEPEKQGAGDENHQVISTFSPHVLYPMKEQNGWISVTQGNFDNPAHTVTADTVTTFLGNNQRASSSRDWCMENVLQNSSTRLEKYRKASGSRPETSTAKPVGEHNINPSGTHTLPPELKVLNFADWYKNHKVNHSLKTRNQRMQWGKNVVHRTKSWKGFIFSDVSTFVLKGNCIKRLSPYQSATDFSQSKIEMFWGCLTFQGPEIIVPVGMNFRSEMLSALLRDEVIPFAKERYPNIIAKLQYYICFSTQYKRTVIADILRKNSMDLEQWPNCVSDINPLEHVWDLIGEKAKDVECSNKEKMISVICNIWEKDEDIKLMCREFVLSMQRIINDMITQGGKSPKMTINWS